MRTLKDFLLSEALLLEEDDSFKPPAGFKKIDARGRLSDQAKDVLGVTSIKSGRDAAATKDGAEAIRKKMGPSSIPHDDPIKFLRLFFGETTPVNDYIDLPKKEQKETDQIQLELTGEWKSIGGKNNWKSSLKVVKFWITSIMRAYGIKEPIEKVGVLHNVSVNRVLVYKKSK